MDNYNDPFYNNGSQNHNNYNQSQGYSNNQNYNNQGANDIAPYSNQNSIFVKRVLPILLAVLLLLTGFGLGFIVKMFTLTEEERLARWVMDTIKSEYLFYDDLTDAEKRFILENMGRGAAYATDRYGDFLTPFMIEELNSAWNGDFVDIGIDYGQGTDDKGTFAYISQVYGNSPADSVGLKKNDRFYSLTYYTKLVDGKLTYVSKGTAGASAYPVYFEKEVRFTHEVDYKIESSLSEIYTEIENIPDKIIFDLTVKRLITDEADPNYLDYTSPITVTLKKESYRPNFVTYESVDADTGIITIMSFGAKNIVDQVDTAMNEFKADNKTKLILDLRGNRGGYVLVFAQIASYFVTDSVNSNKIFVGYAENRNGEETGNYHTNGNKYNNAIEKFVILFDGNSASASEALIGAILDNDYKNMVKTIGTQSYGKGIYQSTIINEGLGYGLYLTCGYMYWPSGKCIDRSVANPAGVKPLKEVNNLYFNNGADQGRDNQLLTALDYMKGLIQINS